MFTNDIENATTMWELWDTPWQGPGMNSRNHHMFNSVGAWFYRYIAGFELNALEHLVVRPRMALDATMMPEFHAEHITIKGALTVEYTRNPQGAAEGSIHMKVQIPANAKGTVMFEPLREQGRVVFIKESGKTLFQREAAQKVSLLQPMAGIVSLSEDETTGVVSAEVGSGAFEFLVQW